MDYEDFVAEGTISQLSAIEQADYIKFHQDSYKEDLEVANKLSLISPRWTVIVGYYAMHDLTKLYLSSQHNLKLSQRGVHSAAISALRKVLGDKETRAKAIKLLKQAEDIYNIYGFKAQALPVILSRSKREREKAQYYSSAINSIELKKATDFLEKVIKPYINLFEKLIKGDKNAT